MTEGTISELIRQRIEREGALRFDTYMGLCLGLDQGPAHQGYYRCQVAIGEAGDFITSPEISQIFGEMIGIWLLDRWYAMGKPACFTLLELGPGRGTLLEDALRLVSRLDSHFMGAMKLCLYEQSQYFRFQQMSKLDAYAPVWLENLGRTDFLNAGHPLLVVSNEFFDALPLRIFEYNEGASIQSWSELYVVLEDKKLSFARFPLKAGLACLMPRPGRSDVRLQQAGSDRGRLWYEVCPAMQRIVRELAGYIAIAGGAMLTIDYGYGDEEELLASEAVDQPQSSDESGVASAKEGRNNIFESNSWRGHARGWPHMTLQAVRKHRFVSPLEDPGETDLSAHVDFSAMSHVARQAGLRVWPLMSQAAMLGSLGGEARLEQLVCSSGSQAQIERLHSAYKRLTACEKAGDMGSLFKVLCVGDLSQSSWLGWEGK